MNEGKGDMIRLGRAYQNGSITEKILLEICILNDWEYTKDEKHGVLIFPKGILQR